MLSYRKLAMRVLGRPLHTGGIDSPRPASQRAAAFILTAAMLITLSAPAFAGTWCIDEGNITVKAGDTKGKNTVSQGNKKDVEDTNTIITGTSNENTVTIDTSKGNVDVTFDDLNIDASSRKEAAMSVTGSGNTTIKLDGDNHLTGGNGRSGIDSIGSLTIYGGENDSLTAQGGAGGSGIHISRNGSLTISGGMVTANGGSGNISGGDGISSSGIDLSGSLELTAKAGKGNNSNGKALSQNGRELELDTIKDKLGPGAKVTATDADGSVIDQVSIPRPVEPEGPVIPEESSSSSGGGSAAPFAPVFSLPGLTVTDKSGAVIDSISTQSGNTLTVCVGRLTASLRASLATLRQLRAEGIETITFQTILCSTTLSVDELLAMGGEDAEAVLTHRFTDSSLTVG